MPAAIALSIVVIFGVIAATVGLSTVAAIHGLAAGLPDPARLEELGFAQPTVLYDRTGKVELARFEREKRRVVTFDEVPKLVLDATTAAEDRTFWDNSGFDPRAIVAAVVTNLSGDGGERGASTITQQLVRARLLLPGDTAPDGDRYLRKIREIIQASRLTAAFPGEDGKRRIMTAYLNQIFYGHGAYGIAAAAQIYFGVSNLEELTPAQAALLAGLPKSPTSLDPYRYAKPDGKGRLVVPQDAEPVLRRNWVLARLSPGRWTTLSAADLERAMHEPVILVGDPTVHWRAPQFTWQVRAQLEGILGGAEPVETGGYRVITSLDWKAQRLAESWVTAAAVAPNLPSAQATKLLAQLRIPAGDRPWIRKLRGKDVHNAALVALDYRTGDVLAYVGSAGYYRDAMASPEFAPKFDVLSSGYRQPGSAFKPILYATAFARRKLTPGSLLLDITTQFGHEWAPRDADQLERGPVLVRRALQYSLNIPAIRALQRVGSEAVAEQAARMGIGFQGGETAFLQAGLAGAIGTVEVRPLDLAAAYGTLANGGRYEPPQFIREVDGPDGRVVYRAPDPAPRQVLDPGAAYLVSDILAGNTDPSVNQFWGPVLALHNGPDGELRPAAAKTGTTNDTRDLATYGYLPPPDDPAAPGLAVGVWMGNSDHSFPRTEKPAISLDGPARIWQAFVRQYTDGRPLAEFKQPDDIVRATIDAWSGGAPGPWTRRRTDEWFLLGTQPGADGAVDEAGLLYSRSCGGWRVDPVAAEVGSSAWLPDVRNWTSRARRGSGVRGPLDSRTAYFWGEASWGGQVIGPCPPPPPPEPAPGEVPPGPGGTPGPPDPGANGNGGGGNGHGGGNGNGGGNGHGPGGGGG
ncbi:MAG TPA: transglycosylase domain-containing protein [Candidatus Limnocylindrales bacterium]